MDRLCSILDKLVECFTCASQTLPPFKLCLDAHMVCTPCFKYLPHCICGQQFADGPHSAIDWMASAMKLRCKYRDGGGGKRRGRWRPSEDVCQTRWFAMQDLNGHYSSECTRNAFQCPIEGCGHSSRIDTVVEHYEGDAHGPIEELVPNNLDWPYQISFQILV